MNASHCPEIDETSIFVWLSTASIKDEWFSVPMMIGAGPECAEVKLETDGRWEVTFDMSDAKV